jgi:hypothetical protein
MEANDTNKPITVQAMISRQDYKALKSYFLHKMKPYRIRNVRIALAAGIVFLIIGEAGILPWLTLRIGLYGLLVLLFAYLWIDAQASKLEKPGKAIEGHQQTVTVSDAGFHVEWIDYSVPFDYTWDLLAYAFETEDYFFFFVKRLNAIIVPKKEIEEENCAAIRDMIAKNILPVKDQIREQMKQKKKRG